MLTLSIKAKPSSKRRELVQQSKNSFIAYLKSPPVDGKANAELISLLSDYFQVPKSSISIKAEFSSSQKLVTIQILPD